PRQGRGHPHRRGQRRRRLHGDPRRRSGVRPRRHPGPARTGARRARHGGVRQLLVRQPQLVLVLVRDGEQGGDDGRERAVQLLPRRPRDLLQADAGRAVQVAGRALARVRDGGGGHRQAVASQVPPVRGAHQVPGAHQGRGQEDHLAGRRGSALDPGPGTGAQADVRRTPLLIGGAAVAVALGCAVVVVAACGGNPRAAPAAVASATGSPTAPTTAAPAPVVTSSAPACPAWGCDQQRRFDAAAALLRSKPGYLGVVVRDRQTGAVWRAGTDDHVMWTSSTIKLAVATSILERARLGQVTLDATARQQMAAMLAVSDNDAADALWNRYGK